MKYISTLLLTLCLFSANAQNKVEYTVVRHDHQLTEKHEFLRSDAKGLVSFTLNAPFTDFIVDATGMVFVQSDVNGQAAPYTFVVLEEQKLEGGKRFLMEMLPNLKTGTLFELTLYDSPREINKTTCRGHIKTNLGAVDIYYIYPL